MIYIVFILLVLFLIVWVYNKNSCRIIKRYTLPYGYVEIVDSQCQDGLPHTSSPYTIRMTEKDWNSSRRDTILLHEKVHLHQRQNPTVWRNFYERVWDYEFTRVPPPNIPSYWVERVRPNPDTEEGLWSVWRRRWVFFPTYGRGDGLRDAITKVWDLQTQKMVDIPMEWKQFFCTGRICPYQNEHPHEISAEFITNTSQSPASQKLHAFLATV